MTATGLSPIAAAPAVDAPPRPSPVRLTVVELRKAVDTRSGRWLLAAIVAAGLALMPVILFTVDAPDQDLGEFFAASQLGVSVLLPVLGILTVTAEWSQRTALSTFLLVPDRHRVLAAKLAACAALAALCTAAGLAVAVLARAAGALLGRSSGAWTVEPRPVATMLLFAVVTTMIGVAFGALFANTPLAIVLYFLLPTVWATLGEMVARLHGAARWLDTAKTLDPLTRPEHIGGVEWARAGVSLLVWLALPLAAGAWRLARREVA
ncbi:ABC transporter permease [Actinomadura parmotrematis]|uniref:ABC transporter permease n=1 Tax=Actinomadura parmotrematis TaxID=2864039 RepID=A0ABS7FTG4_9ACTN|nr:ABC transporter permease [Actinomadura parmotrematis]MBW8483255.1 ABC transporter permease [Actinomadura parmotrematis]